MSSDELLEGAEFGNLPFDTFALERWDHTRPVERDREQWNDLAREWLGLDARGRHPYHSQDTPHPTTATSTQMERVLAPHQTLQERNLSLRTELGRGAPVWLRTCYSRVLAETYAEWCEEVDLETIVGHASQILDDENLYSPFADDWSGILLRVPAIADTVRYMDNETEIYEERYESPGSGEEFKRPLFEAKVKEKTMLFLVDEEALRTNMVKLLWLDVHGRCVWENRLRPDNLLEFHGRMFEGGSLADLYRENDTPEMYQMGALLEID
ncbi:hypothetical protein NUW58_g9575 [Xylaria curta]|uniref:Uncharacterized protein n=1 Tax=Xylaria curta TaxID=42375 RepID=A0ACC1MVK6_9PEZI|nr:hypothetical protein NUW58_g9575 [Xylaria curta]